MITVNKQNNVASSIVSKMVWRSQFFVKLLDAKVTLLRSGKSVAFIGLNLDQAYTD